MFKHIDGHIHIYDRDRLVKTLTVDLKGHKFNSNRELCQYIEFINVRGERGWLFGEADLIAILSEDGNKFYMIYRKDLIEYCENLFGVKLDSSEEAEEKLLNLKCWTNHPSYHNLYRRNNLKDIVTQISMSEVKRLAKMVW